jgi:predicted TIM-barrel fold metal-dependent hydrolase
MPSPHKLLKDMEKKGVKTVKMYPGRANHSFSLREWNSGMLINALAEARVPLMLDVEVVSWDDIIRLIKQHPRLPIICTNVSYRHNRFLYPIFEKYENIYIEISRFYGAGVIEDIVKRFGPHPVLFGSNMPQYTGTAPVAMITYADISLEDKEAIAGENLRILVKEALS